MTKTLDRLILTRHNKRRFLLRIEHMSSLAFLVTELQVRPTSKPSGILVTDCLNT